MKIEIKTWCLAVSLALAVMAPATAFSKNLGVTLTRQLTTDSNGNPIGYEWCWAASSKMVLDYYAAPTGLFGAVAYGVGNAKYDTWNRTWGTGTELHNGVHVWTRVKSLRPGPGRWVRQSKNIQITYRGISEILMGLSGSNINTQTWSRALTAAESDNEINLFEAPFVIRIGWSNGGVNAGGHFVVCYGDNGGVLSIQDPWFGSYIQADAAMHSGPPGTISPSFTNTWTETVTTAKAIDVLFLFDTTGSMGTAIRSAKTSAIALLDQI